MGSSNVIFFLQCTGLAHLCSYVIGANNFTRCNHMNIIKDYQNVLQKDILDSFNGDRNSIKAGDIINCCPELQAKGAVLACIHAFTKTCVAREQPHLWQSTVALLEKNCDGYYSGNNGSQNVEVTFRSTRKCTRQRNGKCGNHTSKELDKMWNSYMRIRNVNIAH